jgi:hypothetical protein
MQVLDNVGVQVGSGNQQTIIYQASDVAPTWPVRVGVVPLAADCYQPRNAATVLQEEGLYRDRATATLITGMGGVEKTQIAAQHARTRWGDCGAAESAPHSNVVWLVRERRRRDLNPRSCKGRQPYLRPVHRFGRHGASEAGVVVAHGCGCVVERRWCCP